MLKLGWSRLCYAALQIKTINGLVALFRRNVKYHLCKCYLDRSPVTNVCIDRIGEHSHEACGVVYCQLIFAES